MGHRPLQKPLGRYPAVVSRRRTRGGGGGVGILRGAACFDPPAATAAPKRARSVRHLVWTLCDDTPSGAVPRRTAAIARRPRRRALAKISMHPKVFVLAAISATTARDSAVGVEGITGGRRERREARRGDYTPIARSRTVRRRSVRRGAWRTDAPRERLDPRRVFRHGVGVTPTSAGETSRTEASFASASVARRVRRRERLQGLEVNLKLDARTARRKLRRIPSSCGGGLFAREGSRPWTRRRA